MSVSEVLFRVFGTLPYIYEHTWRLRLLPKIWITSVSRLICIMFWSVRNLKRLYWNDKTYFHFVDFNQRFFVANRIMYISIFISTWIRLGFLPKNQVESSKIKKTLTFYHRHPKFYPMNFNSRDIHISHRGLAISRRHKKVAKIVAPD